MVRSNDLEDYIASGGPELFAAVADAAVAQRVRDMLVKLRKMQVLSQTDVAKRMKVSQPTISEFENESGDVYLSTLQRYARAVGARLVIAVELDVT